MSLELTMQVLNRTNNLLDKPVKKPTQVKPLKFSQGKLKLKNQMAEISKPFNTLAPPTDATVSIITYAPTTTEAIPEAQTVTSKLTTVYSSPKKVPTMTTIINDRLKKSNNEFDAMDDTDDYSLDEVVEVEPMKIYSLFTDPKKSVATVDKGSSTFQKVDNSFPKDGAAENLDAYLLGAKPEEVKEDPVENKETSSESEEEDEDEEDEEEYEDEYPTAPANVYPPTAAAYQSYNDIPNDYNMYPSMNRYRNGRPPGPPPRRYRPRAPDSVEEPSAEDITAPDTQVAASSVSEEEEDDIEYEKVSKNHYPGGPDNGPPHGDRYPPRPSEGGRPQGRPPPGYNDYPAPNYPSSDEPISAPSRPTTVETYPPGPPAQYGGSGEKPAGGILSSIFSGFSIPWFSSWTNPAVGIPHRPTKNPQSGKYPQQKFSGDVQDDLVSAESSSSEEEEEDEPQGPDPNLENGDYSKKRKPQNTRPHLVVKETGLYPPVVVVDQENSDNQAYYESGKIEHVQQNFDPKRRNKNTKVKTSAQQSQTTYGSGDGYADYFDASPMREMQKQIVDDDERDMLTDFGAVANTFSTSADQTPEFSEEDVKPNQIKGIHSAAASGGKYTIRKKNKNPAPVVTARPTVDSVENSVSSSSEEDYK